MLDILFLDQLKGQKNLLAFSYGTDSTALFWALKNHNIDFDMAIVDYNVRKQSKEEVKEAKKLAKNSQKQLFIKSILPPKNGNFEHFARNARYEFFEQIIKEYKYQNLILAHHLNDAFEWFLMRLAKGSGLSNALMKPSENICKKDVNYAKIRPLYFTHKTQILDFLKGQKLKYFFDKSNEDTKFFRNKIRLEFGNKFLEEFALGIKKSFSYLLLDEKQINFGFGWLNFENLTKRKHPQIGICKDFNALDKLIKNLNYVSTNAQKIELKRQINENNYAVIGGKIAVCKYKNYYFAFLYEKANGGFSKEFKTQSSKYKIPILLRAFLHNHQIDIANFLDIFNDFNENFKI